MNSSRIDVATQYAMDVVEGRIVAGPYVRLACARHLRDLEDGHDRGLSFDADAAQRVYDFFRKVLRLSEGQFDGRPFELHASQQFIVGCLFGWKRADGTRRFRRGYIEQGKGNGKSPMLGGIGLYGLVADDEAGAQIYAAAAKKDQAKILFDDAHKMYLQSPQLKKRLKSFGGDNPWNLAYVRKQSFFRPISKETSTTGSGPRPHFALCDELHEHPDGRTIEMLERGFKFRRQPLLLMITNSGSDRKSVCWDERTHAVNVLEGRTEDDSTFAYVCALDEGDDPLEDPTCWEKANPLLGVTLTREYLASVVDQAKKIPGKQNNILRLHFCVWTDAEKAWLSRKIVESCIDPYMALEDFEGAPCWMGLDLAQTNDIAGKAYIFEDGFNEKGLPKFALFARGYTPEDTLDARALRDKAPYRQWADAGFLVPTPGKKIRFDMIAHAIGEDMMRFDVQEIAYDKWLIKDLEEEFDDAGIAPPTIEHPQSINQRKDTNLWMPGSIDKIELLFMEGRLRVENNPALLSAIASSVMWESPAGLRRFEKNKATARIDLAVAATMAAGAAMQHEAKQEFVDAGSMMVIQ